MGNVVRESDRQRGLCNSREEAQARTVWCYRERRNEASCSQPAGYDEALMYKINGSHLHPSADSIVGV